MKIALCDDCCSDLTIMENHVKNYYPAYDFCSFTSGKALLEACNDTYFDIIFLDIEMSPPTGYEIGKTLHEQGVNSLIIFTTNTLDYAVRGYGIAFRYLPKPISSQMFSDVMELCEKQLLPHTIELATEHKKINIDTNQLVYLEVLNHDIIFHLENGETIELYGTLTGYINKLNPDYFIQIHKSFCINLNHLTITKKNSLILDNEVELPIGRSKKNYFFEKLQAYMRSS